MAFTGDTVVVSTTGVSAVVLKKLLRQKNGSELVLEPLDSATWYLNSSQADERIWQLSYRMETNNSGNLAQTSLPMGNVSVKGKYNATLLQAAGRLLMPFTRTHSHLVNSAGRRGGQYWHNDSWLYFNTRIAEHLVAGDTVVVQTKTVELIKQ